MIASPFSPDDATEYCTTLNTVSDVTAVLGEHGWVTMSVAETAAASAACELASAATLNERAAALAEAMAAWERSRRLEKKRPPPPTWPPPRAIRVVTRCKLRPPVIRKQPRMRAEGNKVRMRISTSNARGSD